ncbi:hypothetical protein P0F65_18925 [Sphingomonas sp. I4]
MEIQDEIELIRDLGCSHIQGFVYGKPTDSVEVHRMLHDRDGRAEPVGLKSHRRPRMKILRTAQVLSGSAVVDVRIRDLSTTGMMIEGCPRLYRVRRRDRHPPGRGPPLARLYPVGARRPGRHRLCRAARRGSPLAGV